jgi:fluoroquinolone transport system ATP-binding protein
MIKVSNLYHSYSKDEHYAVKDVSFEVKEGEIFGFLGPSGAGKSTTQNIMTGLLQLQKGTVTVAGYDVKTISNKMFNQIGMSFEESNVYSKLSAKENLEFYRKLFDVETRDPMELLRMVGLHDKADIRAGEFSKGMKHRLTFARSMINNPTLWFLDEPTTGLDPAIAGAELLSDKWQILLYWIPFYWAYKGNDAVLTQTATWPQIGLYAGIILAISVVVYFLLAPKIKEGLE